MCRAALARPSLAIRPPTRRPLIGLTPLIDVVFILLVFFMLASSFIDRKSIMLGAQTSQGGSPGLEGAMVVDVRSDGLRLAGEALTIEAIAARIGKRLESHPDQRVLVRPARGVALQDTVRVFDRLSSTGVVQLSLTSPAGR